MIAFYVDSLAESELNTKIFNCLNQATNNPNIDDVSLFYNNINFNSNVAKFGIFNSTDLWNYTGLLIATTVDNVNFAKKIANKFKLVYLFTKQKFNIQLMDIIKDVEVVVSSEEDQKEFFRLTGKTSNIIDFDAGKFIEVLT